MQTKLGTMTGLGNAARFSVTQTECVTLGGAPVTAVLSQKAECVNNNTWPTLQPPTAGRGL